MPPDFPDTAVSSATCLWAEYSDIPVDVARQAILYVHASFASELSQHLSADCTCLPKPLLELMVTAVRAVTDDASIHLLCGSDAQSDSSGADAASDSTVAVGPFMPSTSATAAMVAPPDPQTVRQAAQTSRRVLERAPWSPQGASMSHPRPPLYYFRLSLSMGFERGRSRRRIGTRFLGRCTGSNQVDLVTFII